MNRQMNNTSIVNKLKLFADLLELHNGDSFKIKALRNAHSSLRKVAEPIMLMSAETLTQLPGIGKNTSKLILQLAQDGFDPELDRLLSETPEGVVEMFHIKGLDQEDCSFVARYGGGFRRRTYKAL
jgi:DNA polymerase (family 10)